MSDKGWRLMCLHIFIAFCVVMTISVLGATSGDWWSTIGVAFGFTYSYMMGASINE